MVSVSGKAPMDFGEHKGHAVHPHNHDGQDPDHRSDRDWCSGKWFCGTCRAVDRTVPGTWFEGPRCARPAVVRRGK